MSVLGVQEEGLLDFVQTVGLQTSLGEDLRRAEVEVVELRIERDGLRKLMAARVGLASGKEAACKLEARGVRTRGPIDGLSQYAERVVRLPLVVEPLRQADGIVPVVERNKALEFLDWGGVIIDSQVDIAVVETPVARLSADDEQGR